MTMNNNEKRYFEYLCNIIRPPENKYNYLLKILYETDFIYIIKLDENRYKDGLRLRQSFDKDSNINISNMLCGKKCSVLEMLIALSIRMEDIMEDGEPEPYRWFWLMLDNLGLTIITDRQNKEYAYDYINRVIHKLLYREYAKNGEGGLFPLKKFKFDSRNTEIWYQMCWYLTEYEK